MIINLSQGYNLKQKIHYVSVQRSFYQNRFIIECAMKNFVKIP